MPKEAVDEDPDLIPNTLNLAIFWEATARPVSDFLSSTANRWILILTVTGLVLALCTCMRMAAGPGHSPRS